MEDLQYCLSLLGDYPPDYPPPGGPHRWLEHVLYHLLQRPPELTNVWPPLDRQQLASFRSKAFRLLEAMKPNGLLIRRSLLEEAIPSDRCLQMLRWLCLRQLEERFGNVTLVDQGELESRQVQIEREGGRILEQMQTQLEWLQGEYDSMAPYESLTVINALEGTVGYINEQMQAWRNLNLIEDPEGLGEAVEKAKEAISELNALDWNAIESNVWELKGRKSQLLAQLEHLKRKH